MQPGDVIAERFEIERMAGAGGMGAVYRALDRHNGRPVALKTLLTAAEEHSRRFLREVSVLYDLAHPRIVSYIAHGQTPAGELYLVMEWLEGESLADRLKRAPVTIQEAIEIGTRAAEGIAYAHQRGVVHRDLKPGNLYLCDQQLQKLKLLDFGLARLLSTGSDLTRTGAMLGTPGYMAPEQARGDKTIDARTDIFALGCVLYRCMTGRVAFHADDMLALLAKLVLEDAPRVRESNPHVPPDVDELVARMLSRDPAERPADGTALLEQLRALAAVPALPAVGPEDGASGAPLSITSSERRVMCLVLARMTATRGDEEATVMVNQIDTRLQAVRTALRPFGGELTRLVDGSLLVGVSVGGAAEQAARAARCALAMRELLPEAPMALVAIRALRAASGLPLGDGVERAAELLCVEGERRIRVNPVAAALIAEHFDVGRDGSGLYLKGGRAQADKPVMLLGRATPMVGRTRELRTLESTFEECVTEPVARCVLVTGRAGIGKSRLRHELVRSLQTRGTIADHEGEERSFAIWIARGDPMSAGGAFCMVAPLVRQAIGVGAGEPVEATRERLMARIGERVPEAEQWRIGAFLGELIGVPFDQEKSVQLRAAREEPMLMGDQMRRAWEDWLAAECDAQPVLLVLEDLHLGDLASVQFLDAALRHLADKPLMVLALARPEVHELFPKLWAERDVQEIRLGPLTRKAATELVQAVLGRNVAADVVDRVVEQAGGNAFFLEELIRAVSEGKAEGLPETVLAMIQARIEALEPEARRVLRAASVFGQVFWRGAVVALLGEEGSKEDVGFWLEQIVAKELASQRAESKFPGDLELSFRNALVREAAYAMLTEDDRAIGHRLAASWLERLGEREPVVLAEHLERGGERERAIGVYRRAAEQALEGNDLPAAVAHVGRAVGGGARGVELGELRLLEAGARRWRGEFEAMLKAATEASEHLDAGSARWCVAVAEVAVASRALGQAERLVAAATRLQELTPSPEARVSHAKSAARAAMQLFLSGQSERGDRLLQRVTESSGLEELGERDPTAVAWIHQARAFEALYAGDPGGYLAQSAAAASWFEQAGDLRGVWNSRVHQGFAYNEVGAYAQAERALSEALAAAQRMGLFNVVATAKNNLGLALAREGKLPSAEKIENEAIRDSAEQGDRRMEGGSRHYLAIILELQGRLDEAEREALQAAALLESSPPLRAHVLATVARIRLALGRPSDAFDAAREAMEVLESLGGAEEGEAAVRRTYVAALEAVGLKEDAAAALEQACARLDERAGRIKDPAWRQSFLANVPDNAATLAARASRS